MNYRTRYEKLPEYKTLIVEAHRVCDRTCCYCLKRFIGRGKLEMHHTRYNRVGKKSILGTNWFPLCIACHILAHSDENWVKVRGNSVWGNHNISIFEQELQSNFLLLVRAR